MSRIYLFNSFLENWNSLLLFQDFIEKYSIYLMFLLIWVFIWGLYLFKFLINKFKKYVSKKLKLNLDLIWNILVWILFLLLSSFIIYELITNYNEISNLLFKVSYNLFRALFDYKNINL